MIALLPRHPNGILIAIATFALSISHAMSLEESDDTDEEVEHATAVLFPWFAQILGIIVFFLLTRYFPVLPYTAIMFILGTIMGIGAAHSGGEDQLTESIQQWTSIDSEVLLLIFLPGLVFRDAFGMNVHLFFKSFWQLLIMAFPMVLASTTLTALVGRFILPYDWSWNLCMTFGSILAATDPVAISALLNEVGAPPRLKMHISGESMLNDGSAFVFYTIFSLLFLSELDISGVGKEINTQGGFSLFFQMSLGGVAFGIIFGVCLLFILFCLNRKLNTEENVLQVAATVTIAYTTYYVADSHGTSGLIATVFCGVTAKTFGTTMINDSEMMENFWILLEHLLNTLLFVLGGTVWGSIIANTDERDFALKDYGYLVLLYILVNAIRFLVVAAVYPVISRIGLQSNWQEAVFMSYGGLRGAVGLALAMSLDSEVMHAGANDSDKVDSKRLFAMVGGVALLTLLLNGTSCGPLIRKLGLADSSEARKKIVLDFERIAKYHMLDTFVVLLAIPSFKNVDFSVVKEHTAGMLSDLTIEELKAAVERNKDVSPNLKNVLPYLLPCEGAVDMSGLLSTVYEEGSKGAIGEHTEVTTKELTELRRAFVGLLRSAYEEEVGKELLNGRAPLVRDMLLLSLDYASDEINNGTPLNDWEHSQRLSQFATGKCILTAEKFFKYIQGNRKDDPKVCMLDYELQIMNVSRAFAFIEAHRLARERLSNYFANVPAETIVLEESEAQVLLANELIDSYNSDEVDVIVSFLFCNVLLNKMVIYIARHQGIGILTENEAGAFFEEIEQAFNFNRLCLPEQHTSKLTREEKDEFYRSKMI